MLSHQHVLGLLHSNLKGTLSLKGKIQSSKHAYLVTEYLGHDSINLFDLIESQKGSGFGESIGRFFFAQLLDAIEYIHEEVSICHRDLKLENILLTGKL